MLSEPRKVRLVVFDTTRRNEVGPCEQFAHGKTKNDIFVVDRSEILPPNIGFELVNDLNQHCERLDLRSRRVGHCSARTILRLPGGGCACSVSDDAPEDKEDRGASEF